MIRVYDATEKLFNHNGIKALHPLYAEVTKIDNSDYYVELEDTLDNLEYYQKGMIVRVDTPWGEQGFRCDNPDIKNSRINCKAWHLTYDTKNYLIKDNSAVDKNCNDALNYFNDNTDIKSPFKVSSDITALVSTRIVRQSLYEVFELFTSTDKYGGHWDRDNFYFGIKANLGQDRGVVLAYNKNITDISVSENWDNVCTKILPYTTDGETSILLDETYVELGKALYDIPYSKSIKFENIYKKEDFASEEEFLTATKEWLREQAITYLSENELPMVNYSVSAKLDNVSDVGDKIYVKHPRCNVDITTYVIAVKYDAIKGKYNKIEFGNFKKEIKNLTQEIASAVGKETDAKVEETKNLLQSELEEATARINSVLGNSYVINNGNEIIVVDRLPKEEAINCLKINSAGIGFSNRGIDAKYFNSVWSINGTLDMQKIDVINLTASLIKGGTLVVGGSDANDTVGNIQLKDEQNELIAEMNKGGLIVYGTGDNRDYYVKLNAKDGFAGFKKSKIEGIDDEKIYWADGDVFHMKNAEVENEIQIAKKIKIVPVSTNENVGVGFVAIS